VREWDFPCLLKNPLAGRTSTCTCMAFSRAQTHASFPSLGIGGDPGFLRWEDDLNRFRMEECFLGNKFVGGILFTIEKQFQWIFFFQPSGFSRLRSCLFYFPILHLKVFHVKHIGRTRFWHFGSKIGPKMYFSKSSHLSDLPKKKLYQEMVRTQNGGQKSRLGVKNRTRPFVDSRDILKFNLLSKKLPKSRFNHFL